MRTELEWEEPDENLDALAHLVIGAAIEVHRELGPGYLEEVDKEALAIEFGLRRLPFERQKPIAVHFKGHAVGEGRLDFLIAERLIVELKTVEALAPIHQSQLLSCLKTTRLPLGLLINFNVPLLSKGVKRVILSQRSSSPFAEPD